MISRTVLIAVAVFGIQIAFAQSDDGAAFSRRTGSLDDSLPEVSLQGRVIVVPPDSAHAWTWYFLDSNNDGVGDYRLLLGPPWYHPQGGAERPVNGDQANVVAGYFGCPGAQVPMMLVYEINGQFWRQNGDGTSGDPGHRAFRFRYCDDSEESTGSSLPPEIPRVRLTGYYNPPLCDPTIPNPPGVFPHYIGRTDTSEMRNYCLNLGTTWGTSPPFDATCVVGGLVSLSDTMPQWVIVYDLDGQFIREPGDTTNLVPMNPGSAEPIRTGYPVSFLTANNFPNPFNAVTTIMYSVPQPGNVKVTVYDLTGREVAALVNDFQSAGSYAVVWNGSSSASGIYFYRVQTDRKSFVNRMVLLK